MSVLQAIGFMVLGGVIVEVFETHAWRRYQQGRREGNGNNQNNTNSFTVRR